MTTVAVVWTTKQKDDEIEVKLYVELGYFLPSYSIYSLNQYVGKVI
jgi:hypothetical protein